MKARLKWYDWFAFPPVLLALCLGFCWLFGIGIDARADDALKSAPKPTIEQLQSKLAEQMQEVANLQRELLLTRRENSLHQQALFNCQDVIDAKQQQTDTNKPIGKEEKK